jgi:biopolymer transport protein ExbD
MALIIVFHHPLRLLSLFAIITLREPPARFTLENYNFPFAVINGFIVISFMFLICSIIHLAGLIKKRLAIKLIAMSLVVASCSLVGHSIVLHRILKWATPASISILDPYTLIFDIDRRGWTSIQNVQFNDEFISNILEHRIKKYGDRPIIICADKRASFGIVRNVFQLCQNAGANDISLAKQIGFDRFTMPVFGGHAIPAEVDTNMVFTVSVERKHWELNGKRRTFGEMDKVLNDHMETQMNQWYQFRVANDAPYGAVTILLEALKNSHATNLVWQSLLH